MKIKYLFLKLTILILSSYPSFSNDAFVGATFGAGTYMQSDLSRLNREIIADIPVKVKVMSDFPPYFNYETEFGLQVTQNNYVGLSYSHISSGSRSSYKDYSGEYYNDFQASGNSIEYIMYLHLFDKDMIKFYHWFELNFISTSINFTEFHSFDTARNNDFKFKSFNYGIILGVKAAYLSGDYELGMKAGFFWGPKTRIRWQDRDDYIVFLNEEENVHSNWTGLRIGLYFNYHFQIKLSKKLSN